jgi:tmRNA-binding protein
MNKYENILNEFITRNCKLLTTKDELDELLNKSKSNNYKLNYIASFGKNNLFTMYSKIEILE